MALYVRKDGLWRNITFGVPAIAVDGLWINQSAQRFYLDTSLSPTEQNARKYTNQTGKLMLVRAVPGIDTSSAGLEPSDVSGSFSIAYVDDLEVARIRDNGTANSQFLKFETQFLVPKGSQYYVKCFKKNHDQSQTWQGDGTDGTPYVKTVEWAEITFD